VAEFLATPAISAGPRSRAAGEVKRAIAQLAGMVGRDLDYWGADTKAELPAAHVGRSSGARVPRFEAILACLRLDYSFP